MPCVSPVSDGAVLSVRLTPRASRDEVRGLAGTADGEALQVRVRAVPEKGRANTALLTLLAEWLSLPKSSLTLVAGGKSRLKRVHLAGSADELIDAVNSRIRELS